MNSQTLHQRRDVVQMVDVREDDEWAADRKYVSGRLGFSR